MKRCVKVPWTDVKVTKENEELVIHVKGDQARYLIWVKERISSSLRKHERLKGFDIANKTGIPMEDIDFALWIMDMTGDVHNLRRSKFRSN